jgi:hypothetical protein
MPGPTKAFRAGTSREELTKLLVKGGGGEQQKEGSFFFLQENTSASWNWKEGSGWGLEAEAPRPLELHRDLRLLINQYLQDREPLSPLRF